MRGRGWRLAAGQRVQPDAPETGHGIFGVDTECAAQVGPLRIGELREPVPVSGDGDLVADLDNSHVVRGADVGIVQIGNEIAVSADGHRLAQFTDTQRPYLSGAFGVYSEDSVARFWRIRLNPLPGSQAPSPPAHQRTPSPAGPRRPTPHPLSQVIREGSNT